MYLAVIHDRHTDEIYSAFEDVEIAVKQCKEWEKWYSNKYGYEFEIEEIQGWNYYSSAGDDMPKVHVEEIEYNTFTTYEEMLEEK